MDERRQRRGKLTPQVQQKIVEAIRAGNYVSVAAQYAGIDRSTFYRWMERGENSRSGKYRSFFLAVRQAESFAEVRAVAILQSEMKENWRAALSYLERKFPTRWGTSSQRHKDDPDTASQEANNDGTLYQKIAHYEALFERLADEQSPGDDSQLAAQATGGDPGGNGAR